MKSRTTLRFPLLAVVVLLVWPAIDTFRPVHAQSGEAKYEFLKATEDRVWRLNRQTGEISVCTLDGDALVCTTSEQAARPPATSYEELQERDAAALKEREAQDAAEREKALKLLDRMVDMFKEFANEATGEGGQ